MTYNFCAQCGSRLPDAARFCDQCGHPVGRGEAKSPSPAVEAQPLLRPRMEGQAPGSFSPSARSAPSTTTPAARESGSSPGASSEEKTAEVRFQETWEPNERAFSVQVPEGWKISGGIFNVNPQQANGPANSLLPKCDFTVKSDDRGTIMMRWVASWNYADLTFAQTGAAYFQPGQWYRGMPVRLMVSPRQFLYEMLRADRPQASGMRIVAEDPMAEVTAAYERQAVEVNIALQQRGCAPLRFDSLSILVEYREGTELFLESAETTITDSRSGALMWTNENTHVYRAPAAEFESWMPVLNKIQDSAVLNQEWIAAVKQAQGQKAAVALAEQQMMNQQASALVASRRAAREYLQNQHDVYWGSQPSYTPGGGGGAPGGGGGPGGGGRPGGGGKPGGGGGPGGGGRPGGGGARR